MKKFFIHNGLSIAFFLLFIASLGGQAYNGYIEYNKERQENGLMQIEFAKYFRSGHFIQSTFENWESEFLQMALFVWLTIYLKQQGSSESKKFDGSDDCDKEPDPAKSDAPYPVKKGGLLLRIYNHSLTLSLLLLFVVSFVLHFYGSMKDENEQLLSKGAPPQNLVSFAGDSRFWFESFQNWQSEFLSVFAIIVLSIFLRQKGSPQSKAVDAPHTETGD